LLTGRIAQAEWPVSAEAVGHINGAQCLELVACCRYFVGQSRHSKVEILRSAFGRSGRSGGFGNSAGERAGLLLHAEISNVAMEDLPSHSHRKNPGLCAQTSKPRWRPTQTCHQQELREYLIGLIARALTNVDRAEKDCCGNFWGSFLYGPGVCWPFLGASSIV
jgi:hypothetical protein